MSIPPACGYRTKDVLVSFVKTDEVRKIAKRVLQHEINGLVELRKGISDHFDSAVQTILSCPGRVIVTGMGKSGHIGRKIAATLASTGTPAQFVHPAEASHGDLGMLTENDICIAISNSGESRELADILAHANRYGIRVIAITRVKTSTLALRADVLLLLPDVPEACNIGVVPTTSTTATLALGDALAVCLMVIRGFDRDHFLTFHPGGKLGSLLMTVEQLMRKGDDLPVVSPDFPMDSTLLVMTSKGLGLAVVLENDRPMGVISDGDLRRNLPDLLSRTAGEVCTRNPKCIAANRLASDGLKLMNQEKISVLCVVDDCDCLIGVLHVHDCLRAGVE